MIDSIQLPLLAAIEGSTFSPDGTRLYVTGWGPGNLFIVDSDPLSPTYKSILSTISVQHGARSIVVPPSGQFAYIASDGGGVDVIDLRSSSGSFLTHIQNAGSYNSVHKICCSLDGNFVYVTSGGEDPNKLFVIDSNPASATFNTVISTFSVGPTPYFIAVKPN